MFANVSRAAGSFPGGPIQSGESLFRVVVEHIPKKCGIVTGETQDDVHFVEFLDLRDESQVFQLLSKYRFHALGMYAVSGESVSEYTLTSFHLSYESFFRIAPFSQNPGFVLGEFWEFLVEREPIECLVFGNGRLFGQSGVKVVKMSGGIGFAGKARDLFFVNEGIFQQYSVPKGVSPKNHLSRNISASIPSLGTQRFARDNSPHGFHIQSSPRKIAESIKYLLHFGRIEQDFWIVQNSLFRGFKDI